MVVKGARGAGQGPEEESSIVERARGGGAPLHPLFDAGGQSQLCVRTVPSVPLLPICQCAFPVQGEVAVLWTSAGQV